MSSQKLTVKQKKFADEYIKTGNATESYKKAGYKVDKMSSHAISNEASKTLLKPCIKSYIDVQMKNEADKGKRAPRKQLITKPVQRKPRPAKQQRPAGKAADRKPQAKAPKAEKAEGAEA